MVLVSKQTGIKLEKLAHYLAGFVILLKGIDKAEHFREHPFITLFFLAMGLFIGFATYKHHYFEKKFKDFKVLLFLCEAIVLSVVTWYYFNEGKKALPFAYLSATILYYILAAVTFIKTKKVTAHADPPH